MARHPTVSLNLGQTVLKDLRHTQLSGGEIAFSLGFEDPNASNRAFQDWTGPTPDSARNAMHLN